MRCPGQGWTGKNTFCSVKDMASPLKQRAYKLLRNISYGASKTANLLIREAAKYEIREKGHAQITVSGDSSQETSGHSSRIGLSSVIGSKTGKMLDIEVMLSFCKKM